MKVQLFLGKIATWMQNYWFTKLLYRILEAFGLIRLKRYLLSLWFQKHPTQKMYHEKKFFSEHAQELKMVYDFLGDDRSRSVFENVLKFRTASDWSCLKKSMGKDSVKTQYFVPELQFSDREIIVDCGAYNGDTVKSFYKIIPGCRVIALEPNEKYFELLQQCKLEGLTAINAGAWSEDTTLGFSYEEGEISAIDSSGNSEIKVVALDHILECRSATYIKMDIEGAELEALKGAENIIRSKKPKLAICLYHKPQDFFEIPLYIKKLNPDYKMFVHHHATYSDTVLYAI